MRIDEYAKIIYGSKRYCFDGTLLIISDYYTGKTVRLDMANMTQDMLDELEAGSDGQDEDGEE